jgi:CENP-S associating Centromere protein X
MKSTKATGRPSTSNKQKKSRLTSPTPSASDSAAAAEEEAASQPPSPSPAPISEPDFILAEVTCHDDNASDEPVVPLPLLHRILHHNFRDKDKTRITTDAKEVVGKYVEVFVREAIARSAYESQGKGAGGADDGMGRDDGFLEVEDLEKTGIQLVLDF